MAHASILRVVRRHIGLVLACLLLAQAVQAQQRAWTPPETLTPAGQQSKLPRLAMDGSGNALATWIREQSSGATSRLTQSSRLTATGLWGPVLNLYTPAATAAVPSETSDVALNTAGRGAAVWVRATGSAPADQIVQGAIFNGATWSSADNLMLASAAGTRSPRVDVDGTGNAVAVWVQELDAFTVVRAARYQTGGAWSVPVTISVVGENVVEGVALGVDDAGNAVAVWTSTPGGVRTLQAAQFSALTGSWSAAVPIGAAGRSPSVVRLALNRAGTAAFVAFRGFDGGHDIVRAASLDPVSGLWSAPVDVSAPGQDVFELDIAADEQGHAVAVWNRFDGTYRSVQTSRYVGAWSGASDRTTGADTRDVSVDTDAAGNAVATWTSWTGSLHRVQASAYALGSGAWTAAADVSDADGDAAVPLVRLHSDGSAVIVWQSESDYFYIQSSRYVPDTAPVLQPAVVNGSIVGLSWSPGTGPAPSGYTLVASRSSGGDPIAWYSAGLETSLVVAAQDGGYYVRVLATVGGAMVPSNEILVIVGVGPASTVPQDLSAVVSGNTVSLAWAPPANAPIAPVLTYVIAAGSAEGLSDLAFFPTGSALTTFVTPPVPNRSYWVRVRAQSAGGVGPATPDLRVVVGPPPPGAPVLSGGATGPGSVALTWTAAPAPGAPVTGYQLRAGTASGLSNAAVLNLPATALAFATSGVPAGTYYVRVVPLSSAGPGVTSNELVVSVP